MADQDFETLNGMNVVHDQPELNDPTEIQLDVAVPDGVIPVATGGGTNIRTVPLLVRTVP